MDPIAHTLVGAALAETGLKRMSRYATAALLIGVNLPDVDGIAMLWGNDTSLHVRRGWSHGVLALVVLPLLLAGSVRLWHRWRGHRKQGAPPLRMGALLALCVVAVWSHPLLDWMNTYGVRLLMPFDGRWFYGDTLFIIDPWMWLLAAAVVVLARPGDRKETVGWIVLAASATALVMSTDEAPPAVKGVWIGALVALVVLRWALRRVAPGESLARAGMTTLVVYVCAMYGIARTAEAGVQERFATPPDAQVQANPLPGRPFSHRFVVATDSAYRVIAADGQVHELRREPPDRIVQAALASESIRGFVTWMRFPYWKVEQTQAGWIVRFWDLRYQGPDMPGRSIGFAEVEVPRSSVRPDERAGME